MDSFPAQKCFEITDIFRDDYAVFGNASVLHRVVEFAATADVERMDSVMPLSSQIERKVRG